MKKVFLGFLFIFVLSSVFAGTVGAEHDADSDETISVETGLDVVVPYDTGETSYQLQEDAHDSLTDSTGLEVDHYYIWVEVDGQQVLAVDPAKGMY